MGSILSYLFSLVSPAPALDTTPDPGTGLSEKDRSLIRSSWALISDRKTIKQNGVELFIQLFKAFPHMQDYFPLFKGMDHKDLRTCPKMRAHASGVMYMLTSYVDNLDDPETLVALVQKVSVAHVGRGVTDQDFVDLAKMFIPYLRSVLGPSQVTKDTEDAWKKLLGAQTAIFKAHYDEANTKQ